MELKPLIVRIRLQEKLTPTPQELAAFDLDPALADQLAQRLQVVNCELWLVRDALEKAAGAPQAAELQRPGEEIFTFNGMVNLLGLGVPRGSLDLDRQN